MKHWLLGLSALALLGGVGQAKGALILDQHYEPVATDGYTLGTYAFAQTFTVGVSGQLAKVDVNLFQRFGSGTLNLDILDTTNHVPGSNVLASATLPISQIGPGTTWVSLTGFTTPVTQGQELAIRLSTDNAGVSALDWAMDRPGTYSGGQGYGGGNPSWTAEGVDFGFRTYVDPSVSAAPEPSSFALLGIGAVGLLGYAWRRRNPVPKSA
jgi:hypothetical protein